MGEYNEFRDIAALRQRALKAVALMDKMDEVFSSDARENLIIVLMAAMVDSYNKGVQDNKK